ncbi:hypothetical protein B0T25DRAFT_320203 [Lasiosphaeria hispida]|uniref:Uncharacterized protein n=1 Tax=Lasiosphaeria hispida TaxID=260671 RepID=A0AAJ0H9F6_9PEZI|nr:hypothetical protein B0T25DRAFT_320203 [Lasiosphaeria hispida]
MRHRDQGSSHFCSCQALKVTANLRKSFHARLLDQSSRIWGCEPATSSCLSCPQVCVVSSATQFFLAICIVSSGVPSELHAVFKFDPRQPSGWVFQPRRLAVRAHGTPCLGDFCFGSAGFRGISRIQDTRSSGQRARRGTVFASTHHVSLARLPDGPASQQAYHPLVVVTGGISAMPLAAHALLPAARTWSRISRLSIPA